MKKSFSATNFLGGTLCGLVLALCLAAVQNPKAAVTNPPPAPPIQTPLPATSGWADLKFFTYPNGATGIFDPASATLYLYDADLNRCYQTRKIRALGDYMQRW